MEKSVLRMQDEFVFIPSDLSIIELNDILYFTYIDVIFYLRRIHEQLHHLHIISLIIKTNKLWQILAWFDRTKKMHRITPKSWVYLIVPTNWMLNHVWTWKKIQIAWIITHLATHFIPSRAILYGIIGGIIQNWRDDEPTTVISQVCDGSLFFDLAILLISLKRVKLI